MTGSGTQYLSGVSTYTGGTTLASGVLNFTTSALGTGGITFAGGTLQYGANNTQDVSGQIVGSTAPIAIDTNGATVAYTGNLAGSNSGGLTKLGAGMLTLSGTNTYSGTTMVSGGTLQLGTSDPNALPGGALSVRDGVLDLNGNTVSVSRLSGSGATGIITNSAGSQATLTTTQTGSSNFGGSLRDGNGGLGLTLNGSGMLTLTGVNTYSFPTTINAGVLRAGAADAFAPIPTSTSRAARSTPATRRSRSTRSP